MERKAANAPFANVPSSMPLGIPRPPASLLPDSARRPPKLKDRVVCPGCGAERNAAMESTCPACGTKLTNLKRINYPGRTPEKKRLPNPTEVPIKLD
jgi:hypothetical protein